MRHRRPEIEHGLRAGFVFVALLCLLVFLFEVGPPARAESNVATPDLAGAPGIEPGDSGPDGAEGEVLPGAMRSRSLGGQSDMGGPFLANQGFLRLEDFAEGRVDAVATGVARLVEKGREDLAAALDYLAERRDDARPKVPEDTAPPAPTTTAVPPTTLPPPTTAPPTTRPPATTVPVPLPTGVWADLAQCESGGNWSANSGNGYYGGLQFSLSTWAHYGGLLFAAYPHLATAGEQILVAEALVEAAGGSFGAWPHCQAELGLP